ncbi:MAG: hypothetical protein JWR69_1108 [Pedosphaera sp.]|nr:hypothetical protein [Pedosphaera sp.]
MLDIRRVTKEVFEKHGYAKTQETVSPDFTFEKPGTSMNTMVYGGWLGKVWVRVKVYIDPQGGTEFLLRCDTFMVGDHGDPFMEEEHRLTRMKRGPYLELLQEIKMELGLPVEK